MKKIILASVILLYQINAFSQEAGVNTAFRVKQQVKQYWSGTWENYERLTFTFLENGRISEKLKEVFTLNTSTGSWNTFSKEVYIYDSLGRTVETTINQWNNGSWTNYYRIKTEFDQLGNISLKTSESWLNSAWQMQIGEQRFYSYSANAIPDSLQINSWNTSTLQFENRRKYYFQASGNSVSAVNTKTWNTDWMPEKQYANLQFYSNYSSGDFLGWFNNNRNAYEVQTFQNSAFQNYEKGTIDMQYPGKLNSEHYQNWLSNAWTDSIKNEYEYNSDGNITEKRNYSFTNGAWFQYDGSHHTYDTDSDGNISIQTNYAWLNQAFEKQDRIQFIYELFSGINEKADLKFALYPNPTKDFVTIQGKDLNETEIEILDIYGQKVKNAVLQDNKINLKGFENGFYFVKIEYIGTFKVLVNSNVE